LNDETGQRVASTGYTKIHKYLNGKIWKKGIIKRWRRMWETVFKGSKEISL
jgi:hypothetical protein